MGKRRVELNRLEIAWFLGDPEPMRAWLQTEPEWRKEFDIDYRSARYWYQILMAISEPPLPLTEQLFTDLAALLHEAEKKSHRYLQIYTLTLLALAEWLRGNRQQAYSYLQSAFELSTPINNLLHYIARGKTMQRLIEEAVAAGVGGDFAHKILQAFEQIEADPEPTTPLPSPSTTVTPAKPSVTTVALVEPLTEREQEVLALIVAGLSNQEIAERLVVSIATVKRHISNLYGKLGVEHRTQAIVRARALGVI